MSDERALLMNAARAGRDFEIIVLKKRSPLGLGLRTRAGSDKDS